MEHEQNYINERQEIENSPILSAFAGFIEWGAEWLTLSRWMLKSTENIFIKLEFLMLFVTAFCVASLFFIDRIPFVWGMAVSVFLVQRLVEFFVVYSRNFVLNRGRIFTHFHEERVRGQWLLLMFSINVVQIIFVFATWYRFISIHNPEAFTQPLSALDSLYFSVVTFITIGYGEIVPLTTLPKLLIILQSATIFFTLVIVINGLISIHFNKR